MAAVVHVPGLPLAISTLLLFVTGVALCYFLVFGRVFQFVAKVAPPDVGSPLTMALPIACFLNRACFRRPYPCSGDQVDLAFPRDAPGSHEGMDPG